MLAGLERLVPIRWRAAALLPAAALVVHQLRYALAYGDESGHQLAAQGHAYLASYAPVAAMLVAVTVGLFIARLAEAWRGGAADDVRGRTFAQVWLLTAFALVSIYAGQELLEGLLASGHPGGLIGVFGGGGWWAIPVALAVAAIVALALRGARAAIRWATSHQRRRKAARAPATAPRPPRAPFVPRLAPLASTAAGRAPPLSLLIVT